MNERYFVVCEDEDGTLVFATHGFFTTRQAAESYARTLAKARRAIVVTATGEFYKKESAGACGS